MRASAGLFSVFVIGACVSGPEEATDQSALATGYAHLTSAEVVNKTVTETSEAQWSLAKTGVVDTTADTVTWTITTTEQTSQNELVLGGCLDIKNDGRNFATLGNMVINLQTKVSGSWQTLSSDIANATVGAAATTALVDPNSNSASASSFSTNAASGVIALTSPCAGPTFSLEPESSITGGTSKHLGFRATFNNNVLKLSTGTEVRTEVIVSYGNARPNAVVDAHDVDINGNGRIDPDEVWVGGVTRHPRFKVPAPTVGGGNPVIGDTVADITTTGTVTFSNAVFDIGATGGTVTVGYSAGASGGTIENCAMLTGSGVNLQACDTETISAACTPGTSGCPWQAGDVVTYSQNDWGSGSTASAILAADYNTVYASTNDLLIVGVTGVSNQYFMSFSAASDVAAYIPSIGSPGALTTSLSNPTSSPTGSFGGDTVALSLNVDYSQAGFVTGSLGIPVGNLSICDLSATPDLNGLTVSQFLAVANTALSGGATTDTLDDIASLSDSLNFAFESGIPSSFAQTNVFNGACP